MADSFPNPSSLCNLHPPERFHKHNGKLSVVTKPSRKFPDSHVMFKLYGRAVAAVSMPESHGPDEHSTTRKCAFGELCTTFLLSAERGGAVAKQVDSHSREPAWLMTRSLSFILPVSDRECLHDKKRHAVPLLYSYLFCVCLLPRIGSRDLAVKSRPNLFTHSCPGFEPKTSGSKSLTSSGCRNIYRGAITHLAKRDVPPITPDWPAIKSVCNAVSTGQSTHYTGGVELGEGGYRCGLVTRSVNPSGRITVRRVLYRYCYKHGRVVDQATAQELQCPEGSLFALDAATEKRRAYRRSVEAVCLVLACQLQFDWLREANGNGSRNKTRMDVLVFNMTSQEPDNAYHLGSPLVVGRPIINAIEYRVGSGVVWTNRTMASSNTDTNRTGVLTVVDIAYRSPERNIPDEAGSLPRAACRATDLATIQKRNRRSSHASCMAGTCHQCTLNPNHPSVADLICTVQRHDGNAARLARKSDEALGVRVSVARIASSLLDLGCGVPTTVHPTLNHWLRASLIDVKHMYTEVDFSIGSQFIRHALDDSEPIADLQGNKWRVPYCQVWSNNGNTQWGSSQ
ncbi:hypothetical protein PR048_030205 [Dryococelus australis]|uniref:Uncharacterized protein n=1 Tax=Dryococelus australis TaxID=614101 RepID=A0ABQ9GC69_9NEOP|nr:hypothetical protein PR048_030205 [Dryococelus australis]